MTVHRDFDSLVQDWLDEGPSELSERVLAAARHEVHRTTQRRALVPPWRTVMNTRLIAIAAAAAIVVAGLVGLRQLYPPEDVGSIPTTGASASPPYTPLPAPSSAGVRPSPLAVEWDGLGPVGARVATRHPTVDPEGNIWVASGFDSVFWIFSPDGQLLETWGTPGAGEGEFNFVFDGPGDADEGYGGVAFAPDGSFYVVDTGNFRIHRFSADRTFLWSRGGRGTDDAQFVKPVAVDVSEFGTVFVADAGMRSIEKFTPDGGFIHSIARGRAGPYIDEGGRDYVTTNAQPDGSPGLTEYKPDGTVQGQSDLAPAIEFPTGVTRGPGRDVWVASMSGPDGTGTPHRIIQLDQFGTARRVYAGGGEGIAVTDDGDVYVTVSTSPFLRKYRMP